MAGFIGRRKELKRLKGYLDKKTASIMALRGRRRIGKSRLVKEFAEGHRFLSFAGLAPTKVTTKESQLLEFSRQYARECKLPQVDFDDWGTALTYLAKETAKGRVIILLDEISWMGSKDPDFLGKLKDAWDKEFKINDKLILIVCGSASSWIEKNIISSTGFLGRVSLTLKLTELPLSDCREFWGAAGKNISSYEKLKILSLTGGVPKYLEEINPAKTAEENIAELCYQSGGILVKEFNNIFNDLFLHDSKLYKRIVSVLADGAKENKDICAALGMTQASRMTDYLEELSLAGFVRREYAWNLKTGNENSRISKYRLSDNYLRFYLKYLEKNINRIEEGEYHLKSLGSLPNWYTVLGLQFENCVLNNRKIIRDILGVEDAEIMADGPFFQTPTQRRKGCQIDYLLHLRHGTLYVCEIKFSKNLIGMSVVEEVQQKIDRMEKAVGISCRPVLIHVNGVTEDVVESGFFAKIISFGEMLEG